MATFNSEQQHLLIRCTVLFRWIGFGGRYFVFTVHPPMPFESISTSQLEIGSQGRAGEGMDSSAQPHC